MIELTTFFRSFQKNSVYDRIKQVSERYNVKTTTGQRTARIPVDLILWEEHRGQDLQDTLVDFRA